MVFVIFKVFLVSCLWSTVLRMIFAWDFWYLNWFSFFKSYKIWHHLCATRKHIKCRFESRLNGCFRLLYGCCTAIASANSLISDFVFVENPLFSQNYGLQRVDNGLKSKGLNHKSTLETCENTLKSCYVHSLKRITWEKQHKFIAKLS